MVTLDDLGVRIHSDLQYASGAVDCDGQLEVLEVYGNNDELVDLRCAKCFTTTAFKRYVVHSWQERADLK